MSFTPKSNDAPSNLAVDADALIPNADFLLSQGGMFLLFVNPAMQVVRFTPVAKRLVGALLHKDMYEGMPLKSLLQPQFASTVLSAAAKAFSGKKAKCNFIIKAKYLGLNTHVTMQPAWGSDGDIAGIAIQCFATPANAEMVAQRADAATEKALRESNERFHLAARASSDAVYDWDIATNELTWADGLTKLFGWDPGEVNMDRWGLLLHPDDRPSVLEKLQRVIADTEQNIWRVEYRFRHHDGSWHDVLERGFIIRDGAGNAVRFVGVLQDITELRTKEKALIESNERFAFAANAATDIIWDWHLKDDTVHFSDKYKPVLGWSLPADHTIAATECFARIHPLELEPVILDFNSRLANKDEQILENAFRLKRGDGSYAYVVNKAFIKRNDDGKPQRLVGALHDMTDQHYLQHLQDLELRIYTLSSRPGVELNTVLKELALGVGHLHDQAPACIALVSGRVQGSLFEAQLNAPSKAWVHQYLGETDFSNEPEGNGIQMLPVANIFETSTQNVFAEAPGLAIVVPVWDKKQGMLGVIFLFQPHLRTPSNTQLSNFLRLQNLLRNLVVHHQSVAQIRIANERFDNVLRATHDLIWDWDLITGKFYRSPEGMRQIFGADVPAEAVGIQEWVERVHPSDRAKLEKMLENLEHKNGISKYEAEYRVRRNDGSYAWLYDRAIVIRNEAGEPLRMIGAAQDISERKRLESELLEQALSRQKEISKATIDSQEQERAIIGKELHDNVNQVLTTTKLYLDMAKNNPELYNTLLEKASTNVQNVINDVRHLSRSLSDQSIGDLGLVDAIKSLLADLSHNHKIAVTFEPTGNVETELDHSQKLMVFRIVQEAVNNIVKHAQAPTAAVTLQEFNKRILLQISDNGVGFAIENLVQRSGLKDIRNRVYLIGGKMQIAAKLGQGTTLKVTF